MSDKITGYKVFNPDWTCRGFQYAVGETYEEDVEPSCCNRGFHFCRELNDCFGYYSFDPNNKVAEIEALGDIDEEADGNKCCTNKIRIIRELSWKEVLRLVNTGKGNTGRANTGNCNTGNRNTGNRNTGYCNTGNHNTGYRNTGNRNTGNCNTGNRNTGNCNTGNWNTGNCNTGNRNTGNRNTGDCNTGNCNIGDGNQSNYCTGDFNTADNETGCFCTEQRTIRLFNKESDWTLEQWRNSEAYDLLCQIDFKPTEWVNSDKMTDEEKTEHPEYEITGGYLKVNRTDKAFTDWWDRLSDSEKTVIKNIPNFDTAIFEEITGIKVDS